jgi:hypothetical protein
MRFRNRFIHYITPFLLALIFATILAAAAQGLPAGNQTWTEKSWDAAAQEGQANAASIISNPIAFNISGSEPSTIRLGDLEINFTDYVTIQGANELWVRDNAAWSRYKQAAQGDEVDLIVRMPEYGKADIYLISYANSSIKHWNMNFLEGYSLLKLKAAGSGRQFIILASKNLPSNALIIDVSPRPEVVPNSPVDVMAAAPGRSKVTIASERIKGYDVYVDGVFYSSDIADGAIDGNASFILSRDGKHTITISQRNGQGNIINKNEHTKDFKKNTAYTLRIS